ncbi:DNA-3-methyladenine glycosylase family protein [Kribbella sp. CA-253562]|uniref:DNA-3-methyladenine glycosylase family protein n=1 Tax=Kribbella sp. CA-253562 TaxID=3239942 RepID=UPI003D9210E9
MTSSRTVSEHQLTAAAPFDFTASLRFVCQFAPTAGEQQVESGRLTKALRVAGETVVAEVSAGAGSAVDVRLTTAAPQTPETVEAALDRVRFFLSLDDELTAFYAAADGDEPFQAVVRRLHGYHQVKFSSPWENVAWAILSQRTPRSLAAQAKAALIEKTGNLVELDGAVHPAFPDAGQLAALSPAELVECVGNERKAGYLHGSARRWLELSEADLRQAPYEEVREQLLSLPGIGPWSSTFVLIRGLGRMDQAPPDKELLRAAARVYGQSVDETTLARLAGRYGAWQGYWAHYLRAGG